MAKASGKKKAKNLKEETLAIRDAKGNLYLVATKNLPLHQVDASQIKQANNLISGLSTSKYEILGSVRLERDLRRAVYANPMVNIVLDVPSPTS